MTIFSNDYDDISGLTVLLFCPPHGRHWPSRDSLACRDPRLPFVSSRFFMIYLLITKLLQEMSQSGMCFYLFLHGCLPTSTIYMMHRGRFINIMPVCALSAAESLAAVSIGRIIFRAFCIIRMPPIKFYVIL